MSRNLQDYVATAVLNYAFPFYIMHEDVSVTHEQDSFNKNLRNYRF